jgi:hypothetical protein
MTDIIVDTITTEPVKVKKPRAPKGASAPPRREKETAVVKEEKVAVVAPKKTKKAAVVEEKVAVAEPSVVAPKRTKKVKMVEPVVEDEAEPEPEVKAKRAPSAYNTFVKKHMATDAVKALPPRERFAHISKLFKASKEEKASA